MSTENLSESCEHEVTCRVKCRSIRSIISESSFELSCRSCTRLFLMFFKCLFKTININCKTLFLCKLESHLKRKTISIKKRKCLSSRNLSHFLPTAFKCNPESIHDFLKFPNTILKSFCKFCLLHLKFIFYLFGIIFNSIINI